MFFLLKIFSLFSSKISRNWGLDSVCRLFAWFSPLKTGGSLSGEWRPSKCLNSRFFPCIGLFRYFFFPIFQRPLFIFLADILLRRDCIRLKNCSFWFQRTEVSFCLRLFTFSSLTKAWRDFNSMTPKKARGRNYAAKVAMRDQRMAWRNSWTQ